MAFAQGKKLHNERQLYEYALARLAQRMRCVAELKRLMRQKVDAETELGRTLVELVTRRLKDEGYLNDSNYAAAYSALRRDNEKFGRRRVIADLKRKGVVGEVLERAVDSTFSTVDEEKQAREYLRRKRLERPEDKKQAARIFRQLVRAGFGSKTIFGILKKWDVDDEMLCRLGSEAAE
jgi:regulatory protein